MLVIEVFKISLSLEKNFGRLQFVRPSNSKMTDIERQNTELSVNFQYTLNIFIAFFNHFAAHFDKKKSKKRFFFLFSKFAL